MVNRPLKDSTFILFVDSENKMCYSKIRALMKCVYLFLYLYIYLIHMYFNVKIGLSLPLTLTLINNQIL